MAKHGHGRLGLLERERELAALDEVLSATRRGEGNVIAITGPPGIGKSKLLESAVATAANHGIQVFSARGTERERTSPFAIAAQAFGNLWAFADAGERQRLVAGHASHARSVLERADPAQSDPLAVIDGLYWMCVNLTSAAAPAVVAVDDVQWADPPSREFLAHLALRLRDLPIALIVAVRTGEQGRGDDLGWLYSVARRNILRPAPLSRKGVAQVVEWLLPGADTAFTEACERASGGNPFLVAELARTLRDEGVAPTAASARRVKRFLPDTVLKSVLARMNLLGAEARAIAEAVAVLGGGALLRQVARLAEVDPVSAESAADALAQAHILTAGEPLQFIHPLIEHAVYADVPAFARARAHRRAAILLDCDGARIGDVAAHLLLTRPDGDAAAVRTLREAASQAVAQGDMESAAQMLTRAVAEPPVSTERVGLLLELAAAQDYRSDITAEATIREALVLSTAGAERARALTALARFRFNRGEHVAAVQAYDQAFGETGTAGAAAEQLFAEYLTAHIFRAQLHPLGQARLSSVIEAAEQGNPPLDPGLLAHLALRTAFGGGSTDRVRVLAERATARDPLVDPRTRGFFAGMLVQALACVDELVLAEQIADAAITASRQRGSRPAHETASYHRAIPRYHMGALSAALGDLEQALVAADEGWSGSAWVLSLQTHIYLAQGAPAAARKALDRHPELVTGTMDASILLFAKARVELAEGNSATALSDSSEAGRQLAEDFGIDHPGFIAWRETAALAAAGTGDLKLAHELAVEALERARAVAGRRSVSLALRTAAAVSTDDPGATERIDLLSEAASMVEDHPAILERAYTLVDLGAELRAGGHLTAARSALRGGLQISDAIGARALAEKARGQLRATGARPRRAAQTGADALTPAERRVAEIAASGLTNPQIAQDLFVTTKTVETHLANAFRKLGINSRRELPAAFTS